MSVPVAVDEIGAVLEGFGPGYMLTSAEGRVKVVSASPLVLDGVLRVTAPGRGSVANVTGNDVVTLLYPPLESPGTSLLVDGTAVVEGDDVVVTPTAAVLHKPAP